MAKVIGPLHSTEARGRIDSLVYNTWRGIRFVKTYIAPVFKEPDCRIAQKARVAAAVAAWKALSDAARAAWHLFAEQHPELDWSGVPIRWTGANWFISCYTRILRVAGTLPVSPPAGYPPLPLATLTITQTDNNAHIVWTYPTEPEAHTYYVQILKQHLASVGRQPDFHHASIIAHEGIATSPYDDPLTVNGKYAYWARVLDANTGLMTPMLQDTLIFAAVAASGTVIGHLQDIEVEPISGVLVTCGGKSGTSLGNGNFTILLVPAGAQIVTPSTDLYTWNPTHKDIVVVGGATYDSGTFVGTPT